MARFKSMDDRNFRPIVSRLTKFQRDMEHGGRSMGLGEIHVEVSAIEGNQSHFLFEDYLSKAGRNLQCVRAALSSLSDFPWKRGSSDMHGAVLLHAS